MAEILAKTSTAPDFGQMRSDIEKRQGTELKAAKDVALAEYEQKGAELGIQSELAGKKAEKQRELRTELQQEISGLEKQMFPAPERKMTQEDATSYAQLASVVATLGLMLGGGAKGSAKVALSAMNGMMKGWQAGRKDLWERESKTFEAELRKMKAQNDDVNRRIERAMKLMPLKRDEALSELEAASYISSQGILPKSLNTGNYRAALSTLQSMNKEFGALQQLQFKHAQEERRHQETLALRRQQIAAAQAKAQAKTSGAAAGAIERMTQSMSQVSGAINSLASLPVTTTGTVFGPSDFKGLFTVPLSALNNKISEETAQMLRTRMVGVARGLASLETGGAATGLVGLTQKIEQGVDIPAGTPVRVALDKLAEMRRIVEDSARAALKSDKYSESQKALIKENVQIVEHAIPFTQQDVLDSYLASQGKALKVPKKDRNISFTDFVTTYGLGKPKEPLTPVSAPPVEQGQSQGGYTIEEVVE
jgi:hypothetical protein